MHSMLSVSVLLDRVMAVVLRGFLIEGWDSITELYTPNFAE